MIKAAAKIETASGEPNRKKVGKITPAQVTEIAKTKMPDLNTISLESAESMVRGTARSMGIEVG
jgi:large subunit ribosomal protein L11